MFRRIAASLTLIGALACGGGGGGGGDRAWQQYHDAVEPIMNEYEAALAEIGKIDLALLPVPATDSSPAQPPKITVDTAVQQMKAKFIPALEGVSEKAGGLKIEGSEELSKFHAPLAQGLAGKADSYKAIVLAYEKKDSALFEKALGNLALSDQAINTYRREFTEAAQRGSLAKKK